MTVAEDSTAEEFMDFYLDDHTRPKWVRALLPAPTLLIVRAAAFVCKKHDTGHKAVHMVPGQGPAFRQRVSCLYKEQGAHGCNMCMGYTRRHRRAQLAGVHAGCMLS